MTIRHLLPSDSHDVLIFFSAFAFLYNCITIVTTDRSVQNNLRTLEETFNASQAILSSEEERGRIEVHAEIDDYFFII